VGVPLAEKHSGRAFRSVAAAEKQRQATLSNPSRKSKRMSESRIKMSLRGVLCRTNFSEDEGLGACLRIFNSAEKWPDDICRAGAFRSARNVYGQLQALFAPPGP